VSVTLPGQVAPQQIGTSSWPPSSTRPAWNRRARTCTWKPAPRATAATNTPGTNGTGVLMQGYVETSNVNVVEEMVNMIQTQRAYEINSKADHHLRPDAAEAVAAVRGALTMKPSLLLRWPGPDRLRQHADLDRAAPDHGASAGGRTLPAAPSQRRDLPGRSLPSDVRRPPRAPHRRHADH
jgi:hypothetical protein